MMAGTPLADAASFLEAAIAGQAVDDAVSTTSSWGGLAAVSASHAKAEPDLTCYVAGLLNYIGAVQEAEELLDLLTSGLPAGAQLRVKADNVRALLFAVRGDYQKATEIWADALQRETDADVSLLNKIRVNLALTALRTGNPYRARTFISEIAGSGGGPDDRVSVLVASADLAVTALLTGTRPQAAEIAELDTAVWQWGAADTVPPETALEATAQLASVYFDVASSVGQWSDAEQAVEVLETAAQSLSASLGAGDPTALSVRTLLASAELRWALADQSDRRVEQAVTVLDGILRRCRRMLGPAHIQTIRTEVELAAAGYAICSARRSLGEVQEAIDASATVTRLAADALGARHPVTVRAGDCLRDCQLLAAELLGLSDCIIPASRPRTFIEPPGLNISVRAADDDTIRIRISWNEDRAGSMRIRHGAHMPSLRPGTMIPAATVDEYGQELLGEWSDAPGGLALEAGLPRDHRVLVPFMVEGKWAMAGHPTSILMPPPVGQLHAQRTGGYITAGWVWPAGARQAEITWSSPDHGETRQKVTAAQYQEEAGCRLPIGPGGGILTARTISWGADGYIKSDPVSIQVDGAPGRISYMFEYARKIGPFQGRRLTLVVSADVDCTELTLVVRLAREASGRADEVTLGQFDGVSLRRDETITFNLELPVGTRRPYLLRCSVENPGSLVVVNSRAIAQRMP